MQIEQALKYGSTILKNKSDSSALDAEILLSYVLKKSRTFLFTYPEKKLTKTQWQKYKKLIARCAKYEPIAYITRRKEFYGLDFYVDKRVLIPRPKTEELVEKILTYLQKTKHQMSNIKICDVGTGSGCIAIALAKNLPQAKIYAVDISKKALKIAKLNAKKHKVLKQIKFIQSDLFSKISPKTKTQYNNIDNIGYHKNRSSGFCGRGINIISFSQLQKINDIKINIFCFSRSRKTEDTKIKFDIIVANLPYLSKKEYQKTSLTIKSYEPKLALLGGKNGDEIYKKFLKQALLFLKPNGKIFFENY
ncbi:MAG: HemK/PrmC family methyltransferase [Patescibacteria group bacterium]